jgi:hypothetical protein
MDNRTFGLTMIIVGMGGTITALGLLALMMGLLKKIFPVKTATPVDEPPAEEPPGPDERPLDACEDEAAPC